MTQPFYHPPSPPQSRGYDSHSTQALSNAHDPHVWVDIGQEDEREVLGQVAQHGTDTARADTAEAGPPGGNDASFQTHFIAPAEDVGLVLDEEPPEVTRGFKAHESAEQLDFGLDWMQGTLPSGDVPALLSAVSDALGCTHDDWVESETGMQGYQDVLLGPGGSRVLSAPKGRDDCHFILPGKAMGLIPLHRAERFVIETKALGVKFTRIDARFDDRKRRCSVDEFKARFLADDAVTRAGVWSFVESGHKGKAARKLRRRAQDVGWQRPLTGATFYVGSPKAERRLRYYDKGAESLSSESFIDANRLEFQCREDSADALAELLLSNLSRWAEVCIRQLLSFLDFRDPGSYRSHKERRTRCEWWAEFVGFLTGLRYYRPKPVQTIDGAIAWIGSQVSPILATLREFLGPAYEPFMVLQAEQGERRMRSKHKQMLAGA